MLRQKVRLSVISKFNGRHATTEGTADMLRQKVRLSVISNFAASLSSRQAILTLLQ
jgi:hypothetical protein